MAKLIADVVVQAPSEQVFALLVDWPRQGEWIPATSVSVQSGDGCSVGSLVLARSAVGPIGFDDWLRITRWQPPFLVDVAHIGWPVSGPARFRVVPIDEQSCRVIVAEHLRMPAGQFGEFAWHAIKPIARVGLQQALGRLRAIAEAESRTNPQRS